MRATFREQTAQKQGVRDSPPLVVDTGVYENEASDYQVMISLEADMSASLVLFIENI